MKQQHLPTDHWIKRLPVPTSRRAVSMLLTDHQLNTSEDFVELVRLGPKALPIPLKALDDHLMDGT